MIEPYITIVGFYDSYKQGYLSELLSSQSQGGGELGFARKGMNKHASFNKVGHLPIFKQSKRGWEPSKFNLHIVMSQL